jgi:hypothetical protein
MEAIARRASVRLREQARPEQTSFERVELNRAVEAPPGG